MKLISPSTEILSLLDGDTILGNIEIAGRTCYKSEDKMTETSRREFVGMLIRRGHESVLEHQSMSVRFICDRGVSHELVRHRIASFSQESTRYCDYGKKGMEFIVPPFFGDNGDDIRSLEERTWTRAMEQAEYNYDELLRYGWTPQQARSVLPNSLKTEIVVTANLREWRTIFKQRCGPAAHPQMRELMIPLLKKFKKQIPVVFDDLDFE